MITFEQIKEANDSIVAITLTRKDKKTGQQVSKEYAEVNQRIKAFRMCYPTGAILTEMVSNENGVCVFNATCGYYEDGKLVVLGTGTAYEKESSSLVNETSYIENCETSAVGRALGMCGFGIDTSVASAEEVRNAINNQEEPKATPKQIEVLQKVYTGELLDKLLKANSISKIEDISMAKASELITKLKNKEK